MNDYSFNCPGFRPGWAAMRQARRARPGGIPLREPRKGGVVQKTMFFGTVRTSRTINLPEMCVMGLKPAADRLGIRQALDFICIAHLIPGRASKYERG